MTDDQYPGDEWPPVPPAAGGDGGGDADPRLPGAVDPTSAAPARPHYTTGPGEPPERVGSAGVFGGRGGGGSSSGGGGGPIPPSGGGGERPAWLFPAAGGLAAGLVVALVAFFVLSSDDGGDGDDELASTDSTTPTVVETTLPPEGGDTGSDSPVTTVAQDVETPETTVADGEGGETSATTVDPADGGDSGGDGGSAGDGTDGGESTDPCAAGYTPVSALPFDLCSRGDVVADAQFTLSEFVPIDVDGFYGPTSFAAVQEIQRTLGVEPDGIVSQELLDRLIGSVPETEFVVATPGTIRVIDREYPITTTCRTVPLAGSTGGYQVTSYVFDTGFGSEVVDRWFDEGGSTGAYYAGQDVPITELERGFGLEIVEGDSLVTVSVHPVDVPADTCVGRVVEFADDGAQSRLYSVVAACSVDGGLRLSLSENATLGITDTGDDTPTVQFASGATAPFLFGEDPDARRSDDGSTLTVNATIESGGEVRSYVVTYPNSPFGSC